MNNAVLRISSFTLLTLCGLILGTQYIAYSLGNDIALAGNIFQLGSISVYPPWKMFVWDATYGESYDVIFTVAFLILAAFSLLGMGSLFAISSLEARGKVPTTHGSARWANDREIRESLVLEDSGVVLGTDEHKRPYRHNGPEHVKVIAPTRSGKGIGLVVPSLLSWEGSVLTFDPKGENWKLTAGYRSKFSNVIYFNPTDLASARYNPLLEVRKGLLEVRDVQNIADMIVDPDGTGMMDHWAKTGHSLLVGAILHVLYSENDKSLTGVANLLSNPKMSIADTLEIMMKSPHLESGETHPVVAATARDMLNKSENERSGVLSTAMTFLSVYRDPVVSRNTSGSDFRINHLMAGAHPLSVYLVIPGSDITRLRPLFRLIINQFCRRLTESLEYVDESAIEMKKHRLLLLLDEFPSLGRLDFFETVLAYIAGYGMKAMLISQSKNQLDKVYGDKNSIVDNCHVRVFHTPNTIETAELISRMLGQTTHVYQTRNFGGNRLAPWLSHLTVSGQAIGRALLTAGEVMEFPQSDQIIFVSGKPPIRARKLRYFEDDRFIWRVVPPPDLPKDGVYPFRPKLTASHWESMASSEKTALISSLKKGGKFQI